MGIQEKYFMLHVLIIIELTLFCSIIQMLLLIRSDKGGENVDVWRYTLYYHNMDSSSVITGSSTHNQHIERLWCDVFRSVGQNFYELLYSLEDEGILDPLNDIDLFCIHFTILPKLASCLNEFVESWNHHCLSTENNLTPEQLYTIGMMERQATCQQHQHISQSSTSNFNSVDLSSYAVDDTVTVDVPATSADICSTLHGQLLSLQSRLGIEGINKNFWKRFLHTSNTKYWPPHAQWVRAMFSIGFTFLLLIKCCTHNYTRLFPKSHMTINQLLDGIMPIFFQSHIHWE